MWDEDSELHDELSEVSLEQALEQEEQEWYSKTEKLLQEELLELELSVELQLEEQQVGLLSEWQLQEQLDEKDHSEGLLEEELLEKDGREELLLEEDDGGIEQLDAEQLQLKLECDKQDIDLEEQQLEMLVSLGEEQQLLEDVENIEGEEDEILDEVELLLPLKLLELELVLLPLLLLELEEQLWLRIDDESELLEELMENSLEEALEQDEHE